MDNQYLDWHRLSTTDLLAHRAHVFAGLPRTPQGLRGSVVFKHTRCGKSSCHCARGGPGHPHHYLSSTVQGRTHLDHIPADCTDWVQTQIDVYRQWQRAVVTITEINRELFRRRVRDGTEGKQEDDDHETHR